MRRPSLVILFLGLASGVAALVFVPGFVFTLTAPWTWGQPDKGAPLATTLLSFIGLSVVSWILVRGYLTGMERYEAWTIGRDLDMKQRQAFAAKQAARDGKLWPPPPSGG